VTRARRRRYHLSDGRRTPRDFPDYVELFVARRIGRDLSATEGCVVQLVALLIAFAIIYWAFTSGLVTAVATELAKWYVSQMHFGPTAAPSPTLLPSPTVR